MDNASKTSRSPQPSTLVMRQHIGTRNENTPRNRTCSRSSNRDALPPQKKHKLDKLDEVAVMHLQLEKIQDSRAGAKADPAADQRAGGGKVTGCGFERKNFLGGRGWWITACKH
ncbi:hypothetical protein Hypma_001983 [Hypsizygus marmoreus]|uniref:Uncharacterized protein n=1 Tax=Hypsizygus marmoreus TaxID=39966 RepID=A0A369JBR0_HYPMA|nr:hypothetical protein Hypma_001983 [Hypsizygus marmoreus]